MSTGSEPIRSYQRIFRPERRIYHLEGRALPIPGGVPLRWLAYATVALMAVLAVGSGSLVFALLVASTAGIAGFLLGGGLAAAAAATTALGSTWLVGLVLGMLDWPLRVIVIPVALATLATQATPDGRRADRFAVSWLALRLAPRRRSLGRALPALGRPQLRATEIWVAPDEHSPRPRRARVCGSGTIRFAAEMRVRRAGIRQRQLIARPAGGRRRRDELVTSSLVLAEGEAVEVRP